MDIRKKMKIGDSRYDTTRAMSDPEIREDIISDLTPSEDVETVVALETLGLPIGLLVAESCGSKFVPLREKGKIPAPKDKLESVQVDYESRDKSLVVDTRNISEDDTILIVDDWIETGLQIEASIELLDPLCDEIVAVSTIGTDKNTNYPFLDDYSLYTILDE